MARIFVTGSADGVGLATARALVADGHTVLAHARTVQRADEVRDQLSGAESILIADHASQSETIELAEQVNACGRCDAVIHSRSGWEDPSSVPLVASPAGSAYVGY
jgi:NAD(P)-dependent dehydrogenase (short-subunit alcohol dehydrogenase family)